MSDEFASKILGMLTHLTAETAALRGDVAGLRSEMTGLRGEVTELRDGVALQGEKLSQLDGRVKLIAALNNSVEIKVDRVHADMHDVKMRLTGLDSSVASFAATFHAQSSRTDRLDVQLALVEKRLELRDAGMR